MTVGDKIRSMTDEELIKSGIINSSKFYGRVPEYKYDEFDHTYYGDKDIACKQYLELDISKVDDNLIVKEK